MSKSDIQAYEVSLIEQLRSIPAKIRAISAENADLRAKLQAAEQRIEELQQLNAVAVERGDKAEQREREAWNNAVELCASAALAFTGPKRYMLDVILAIKRPSPGGKE